MSRRHHLDAKFLALGDFRLDRCNEWDFPTVFAIRSPAATDAISKLHEKAKKEGGKLTLYAPLSARAMNVIPAAFMKRFPA